MKTLMNKIIHCLRSAWLKKIKRCRTVDIDWSDGTKNIYRITDNQKVIIAVNFNADELTDLCIPKATTHFYAKDTNAKEPYKGLTTWVNPNSIKHLHFIEGEKCNKCGGIKKSKVSYENGFEQYICLCDWLLPKTSKQL